MSGKEIKVLSLVPYPFLPPKMGGQKGIAFFNAFISRELNLVCVSVKNNDTGFAKGYPVKNILSNSKIRYINPFYFFLLKKIIRREKITHLVIEHPYYGWLGILLKWFCKIKLAVHSHNIEALRFKTINKWWWGILWNYEKMVHRHAHLSFFIHDDDRNFAIEKFKLDKARCLTVTYGFELTASPGESERAAARQSLVKQYNIPPGEKLLLFNGTLDYKPNTDALDIIINNINPLLMMTRDYFYKIIICGKNLPAHYDQLAAYRNKNIIYAGFVDDITLYFNACDVFINPVTDGGGIKTKLVEALGHNMNVVTTVSGSIGVPLSVTGNKMKVMADNNWESFVAEITSCDPDASIPPAFFDHFYWGNIAKKAATALINL
jgi:hypothetical protein